MYWLAKAFNSPRHSPTLRRSAGGEVEARKQVAEMRHLPDRRRRTLEAAVCGARPASGHPYGGEAELACLLEACLRLRDRPHFAREADFAEHHCIRGDRHLTCR